MANKKTTMTDLRIIIRGLASNTSKRKISRDCGISRTTISIYEQRAEESEYTWEELLAMDDFGLQPFDTNSRLALHQILEDCYERKSVIVTSQLHVG